MENLTIRPVKENEIPELQNIGRLTFIETFADHNSKENMTHYLEAGFSAEKLKRELQDKNSEFYFAIYNNDIVGYLKLNSGSSQTEIKDDNYLEIERIYVLKSFHGQRVGKLLFEKSVETAHRKMADFLWLGVWEKNDRAIAFYRKNGFIEFGKHVFRLGDDEQTDLMMKVDVKNLTNPEK